VSDDTVRQHLVRVLDWEDAHVGFDRAAEGVAAGVRGRRPEGLPYSPWELLEHLRIAQRDILDFCLDPDYTELEWPREYWPAPGRVPTDAEWEASVEAFRADRDSLKRLAAEADLFAAIPHGTGQTYLRELLLVADHTAYHVGQLVAVRRLLGVWD
jgi:uncharacterized damage-inducible protein DinB